MKTSSLIFMLCAGFLLIGQPKDSFANPFAHGDKPLPVVQGVRATADVGKVKLNWHPVPRSDGYRIYCASEADGYPKTLRHDVAAHPTAYEYADLKAGTTYTFRISALRRGKEGPASLPTTVTPTSAATTGPSDSAR